MIAARRWSLAVVGAFVAFPLAAQQAAPAAVASTDDLLRIVATVRDAENQKRAQWTAEFDAATAADQAAMLRRAEQARDAIEASANTLADTYSDNEVRINDLNRQLIEKAASLGLGELFGLARQSAGEAAVALNQSLVTTQFPTAPGELRRDDWLREFAAGRAVPGAAELERLWFELQREITAGGQVASYRAAVVQPGGDLVDSDVVRIGTFNATADGAFLSYLPVLGQLSVLPRQLPGEFMATAAEFGEVQSGYARAVVDSTRGVLLGLYVERPTLVERIELGEEIGYVIIIVGLAGAVLFLLQLVKLIGVRIAIARQLKSLDHLRPDNPLGRVLLAFKGDPKNIEEDADVAELRITEAVLKEVPKLERSQSFLRLAVAAGPLLGLIGTVWGMILTFQSITESGSSDPKLMATGIGQAMIATVLGLGIAIPLLFANALLNALSRTVVQTLDEQSAGMLAESIERRRRA